MLKVLIVCGLLALSGATYYVTGGKFDDLATKLDPAAFSKNFGSQDNAAKTPTQTGAAPKPDSAAPKGIAGRSIAVEAAAAVATTSTQDLRAIGTLQSDESVKRFSSERSRFWVTHLLRRFFCVIFVGV